MEWSSMMRTRMWCWLLLIALPGCLGLSAPEEEPEAPVVRSRRPRRRKPRERDWTLVFHDQFERKELGPRWIVLHGRWSIQQGRLHGRARQVGAVRLKYHAPNDVRIEYDVRCGPTRPGRDVGCCFGFNGDNLGFGYRAGFGSNGKENTFLDRKGVTMRATTKTHRRPRRIHHFLIDRIGRTVRVYVDEQKVLEFEDDEVLRGPEHGGIALFLYGNEAVFDNVKIYE